MCLKAGPALYNSLIHSANVYENLVYARYYRHNSEPDCQSFCPSRVYILEEGRIIILVIQIRFKQGNDQLEQIG